MKMEEGGARDCNMQMRMENSSPAPKILEIEIFDYSDRTRRAESIGVGLVALGRFVYEIWRFFCCCCCQIFTIDFFVDTGEVGYGEFNGVGPAVF